MSVRPGQESSVFRKPTAPPPDRAAQRRGPEARSDRSVVIPARVASSLTRTVREQLAYLTPDQQRAFLWRYRAQAKSPVVALAFTSGPAEVLAYMPAVAWRSGTGMVVWPDVKN